MTSILQGPANRGLLSCMLILIFLYIEMIF